MANVEKIVTREVVFETADRLKASGVEPSNRKVLHELGGGSMTTIAGHLRDWKAQQDIAAPAPVEAVEVPASVLDAGNHAVAAIWQACSIEARREIEAVTEQANQRIKEAEGDRDKVLTELAEAEAELTTEQARAGALEKDVAGLRDQCMALQADNEHLQTEEQKAKAVAEEIERRAAELADSLKHERERADKLAADVAALQPVAQRVASVESANEGLRESLVAERQQREELAKAERSLATDLARAQADNTRLAEQLADVKKRSTEEILRGSEKVQRMEAEREAARREAGEAAVANGKLSGQLEALQRQVSEQTATLRALTPKTNEPGPAPAGSKKGSAKGADN
ncbi:MAG: DNA-binding protein [Burkholderia gladioli]